MRILDDCQVCQWAEERRLRCGTDSAVQLPQLESRDRKAYADGRRSGREAEAARDLIESLGEWDECLVRITSWGVWPSGEDWPEFYAWRGSLGERRSLDMARGHLFDASEIQLLTDLAALIMKNAWDADVLPSRNGTADGLRGKISHDEWYEVLAPGS